METNTSTTSMKSLPIAQESDPRQQIQSLIIKIVKAMTDYPDELKVLYMVGEQTTVYRIKCHKSDVGKVIGKQGKNINSMRTILLAVAAKYKLRCVLELDE